MAALTAVGSSRVSARQPTYFSCVAKRSRQEKATLRWRSALRADCTRRQYLKREASETRFAQTADASLSVSVPADASPSNGDPRQKPRQNQQQRQRQRHRSLRGQGPRRRIVQCASLIAPHGSSAWAPMAARPYPASSAACNCGAPAGIRAAGTANIQDAATAIARHRKTAAHGPDR